MEIEAALSFLTAQPYLGVFLMMALCGTLNPVPEDALLLATGYLAFEGHVDLVPALGLAWAGVLCGDTALFFIGRLITRGARNGRVPWPLGHFISSSRLSNRLATLASWGPFIAIIGRFAVGMRGTVIMCAGGSGMSYRTFLGLDAMAGTVSVSGLVVLGYALGEKLRAARGWLVDGQRGVFVAVVALVVIYLVVRWWRRRGRGDEEVLASPS